MLAMKDTVSAMVTAAIAATAFTPGAGDESTIALFQNNPTLTPNTVVEDLELADFSGSTPKACAAGAAGKALDILTGGWEIRPKEPAGGFEFIATDEANLPQTIYGFAMLNGDGELQAAEKFETPITLTFRNQVVDVPQPILRFAYSPLT